MRLRPAPDLTPRARALPRTALALVVTAAAALAVAGTSVTASEAATSLGAATSYPVQDKPRAVAVADLNGDSFADLAVANANSASVSVLLGDAAGGFGTATHTPMVTGSGRVLNSVAVGSLDGDAFPDLVVGVGGLGVASWVQVLLGKGDGTFAAPVEFEAGNDPWAVVTGSFTGDAFTDIAVANKNPGTGNVSVLAGNGAGGFAAPVAFPVGGQPYAIVAADLSGDGRVDLVTANREGNDLSVLLANDSGSFNAATSVPVGNNPIALAVGNLGGTAALDLAVADDISDGTVTVLLGDGTGAFNALPPVVTGDGAGAVAIGDLNADSFADVAVGNYFSDTVSVLSGNGTGVLGSTVDYPSEDPYAVAIGAFGLPAVPGLVSVNEGTDDVWVRLGVEGGAAPTLSFSPTSLSFGKQERGVRSATRSVMIVNDGPAAVTIELVGVAGAHIEDFPLVSEPCSGLVVPPGAACPFTVAFKPTGLGTRTAQVVAIPAGGSAVGLDVSGTGVTGKIGKVSVSGPAKAAKGARSTYRVTIPNSGGATATGVKLTVAGKGVSANLTVGKVAAGSTRTAKVSLRPGTTGRIKVTFKVTSANAGSKIVTKTITVTRP